MHKSIQHLFIPLFALKHIKIMISQSIFLGMIGWPQVIIIIVAIVLLFGGKKIPELMRGLGSGIKEFKDASKEDDKQQDKKND